VRQSRVPNEWKEAKVIPVYKKGVGPWCQIIDLYRSLPYYVKH